MLIHRLREQIDRAIALAEAELDQSESGG